MSAMGARLGRLEREATELLLRRKAEEHGIPIAELREEYEAVTTVATAYMAEGLSQEQALRRVAADRGLDYDVLLAGGEGPER
jgi:hypothetical protein